MATSTEITKVPEMEVVINDGILDDGSATLNQLIDLISEGRPIADHDVKKLYGLLDQFQAKIDLTQVGQAVHALGRQRRTNSLIDAIERDLLGGDENERLIKLALMDADTKIKLLKVLLDDKKNQIEYLSSRASNPTISGSDRMAAPLSNQSQGEAQKPRSVMNPAQRKRIMSIVNQTLHLAKKAGEEVVDQEPSEG